MSTRPRYKPRYRQLGLDLSVVGGLEQTTGAGGAVESPASIRRTMVSERPVDFGRRVFGARKDLWAAAPSAEGLDEMSPDERAAVVSKDVVWPRRDWLGEERAGRDRSVLWVEKRVRDSLPARPRPDEGAQRRFVEEVLRYREGLEACDTVEEAIAFCRQAVHDGVRTLGRNDRSFSVLSSVGSSTPRSIERELGRHEFNFPPDQRALLRRGVLATRVASRTPIEDVRWLGADARTAFGGALLKDDWGHVATSLAGGRLSLDALPSTWVVARKAPGWRDVWLVDSVHGDRDSAMGRAAEVAGARSPREGSRKPAMRVTPLSSVRREGLDLRGGAHAAPADFVYTLGVSGGQFGNWVSEQERRQSLDMAFDAMCDIALALGVDTHDVTFGGRLSIAWGARGKGSALAHYEPLERVINLTRMRGAGSLAHEWVHALDDHLGRSMGGRTFATSDDYPSGMRAAARLSADLRGLGFARAWAALDAVSGRVSALMSAIREAPDGGPTEFLANARTLAGRYAKGAGDPGYWDSPVELLARAGAAWVKDRLEAVGIADDYLCGHAEGKLTCPHGEERRRIDAAFDDLLAAAKEAGILHDVPDPVMRRAALLAGEMERNAVAADRSARAMGEGFAMTGMAGQCAWGARLDADGTVAEVRVRPTGEGGLLEPDGPWPWFSMRAREVAFEPGCVAPADASGMFAGCASLRVVDMTGLSCHGVRRAARMFAGAVAMRALRVDPADAGVLVVAGEDFSDLPAAAREQVGLRPPVAAERREPGPGRDEGR